ncbi:MAG TPA: ABC transporter substrate-binding protein [Gammaproteobacteria bacterium]
MKRLHSLLAATLLWLPLTLAAALDDPRELVMDTTDKMLAKIQQEKPALDVNPRLIDQFVIDIVLPHFDFEAMSRSVLGKHWQRASGEERQQFLLEFRNLLIRTYATALLEYSGQKIEFLPLPPSGPQADVTVRTEIQQPGGLPIPINYRMEKQAGGWKVYDVLIDGVSLVGNYRVSFGNEIRSSGLPKLLETMRKRNAEAHGS